MAPREVIANFGAISDEPEGERIFLDEFNGHSERFKPIN